MMSERFYIHCGDDINKQLMDTESDFNIHVEEIGSDEELIRLCNLLNKQQATINKLEQETRRLRKSNDEDICLDVMGSCYTWSIK